MATSKLNAQRPRHAADDPRDPPDVKGRTGSPAASAPLRGTVDAQQASRDFAAQQAQPRKAVQLDIQPSPDAGEAVTLRQQAAEIAIVDKSSHTQALEFVRGAKQLKRKIEDHWMRITRNVDDLKRNLLDLKRADLEPVEAALAQIDGRIVEYVERENRRRREEEDRQRRENEERARQDRERELAEQEAEAARIEAQTETLSAREEVFVNAIVTHHFLPSRAAERAGYKNPIPTSVKLLATPKIADAIASRKAAAEIRQQAEAVKQQPLTVEAPSVPSNLGRAAGTRMVTSYSCEPDVDLDALFQAAILNPDLRRAFSANTVYLNQQARALRESFESVFPGCRLHKSTTVAG